MGQSLVSMEKKSRSFHTYRFYKLIRKNIIARNPSLGKKHFVRWDTRHKIFDHLKIKHPKWGYGKIEELGPKRKSRSFKRRMNVMFFDLFLNGMIMDMLENKSHLIVPSLNARYHIGYNDLLTRCVLIEKLNPKHLFAGQHKGPFSRVRWMKNYWLLGVRYQRKMVQFETRGYKY